jgi:hypothetical protein
MATDKKAPTELKQPKPKSQSELSNEQLDQVTGGSISFEYGKLEVEYKPQNPDGGPEVKKK